MLAALLDRPDAPPIALLAARELGTATVAGTLGQVGPRFPNRSIWMQLLLPGALARLRPRLCHFTNSIAPLFMRSPYIITIHDMALFLLPGTQATRHLAAARGIVPRAAKQAETVITVSESARTDILRVLNIAPEKVRVVYPAAAAVFHPEHDDRARDTVRARYRLPDSFVLHVGTVEPRKNLLRLVEAFGRLRREGRSEQLVLAGPFGWKYRGLLRAIDRARLASSVRFLGYVDPDDLPVIYSLARVVAQPSLYEGFGFPILEGMATGVPVLTSDRSAMAEIGAGAALLVDPESTDAVADGLCRLLDEDDLRSHLRATGLRRAAEFSWQRTAEQVLRIYDEAGG
jgi:glycosyltransferase involved in cell wall biosynthesis